MPALTISDVVDLFLKAENELKTIEQLNEALPIPPVNELRYAGNHLARAWDAFNKGDEPTRDDEILMAAKHCQRSIYDSYEMGIQFQLDRVNKFRDDYRKIPVTQTLKNYSELRAQATRAYKHIQEVATKHKGNREVYYDDCREHYKKIEDVADILDASRDDLNVQIDLDIRNTRRWALGIGLSLIGVIVVLIKLIP